MDSNSVVTTPVGSLGASSGTWTGKRPLATSPSDAPTQLPSTKKPARNLEDKVAHADVANGESDWVSEVSDRLVMDLSFSSEEQEGEQVQQTAEQDQGWTQVGRSGRAARHQNAPRPKFKLGALGDHETAYRAITALEEEYPALRMEVRPNLKAEYILTPKDEDSAALLRRLAEEGNKVLLLDPSLRKHKVVLQRYPLDLPLDAVRGHANVLSATRLRATRDNIPTRQVLVELQGPPPAKLDLGCWGSYTLRAFQGEPVRCYKCQRFNHLQARCEHSARCGVCSGPHPTEDCIGRHKANEPTTAKCPNCGKKHHAWNPQCPERLRRMRRPPQRQQHHQQHQRGGPQHQRRWEPPRGQQQRGQQRQQRFVPAPPPTRPAWGSQPTPQDPTPSQARQHCFLPALPPARSSWASQPTPPGPHPLPGKDRCGAPTVGEQGRRRPR